MKRHEKRWEQRREREEAAYDRRIEQIDTAIEEEKKAEETRQRIFEAEQRRIERMAATFNRHTQFNVALNTGDLDEAARIMNDQNADVERWTTEDAAEKSKTASEKRIEAMEKEIERIEEAKERRLEILDEIEAAEKEKLKARQEREKRAIEL